MADYTYKAVLYKTQMFPGDVDRPRYIANYLSTCPNKTIVLKKETSSTTFYKHISIMDFDKITLMLTDNEAFMHYYNYLVLERYVDDVLTFSAHYYAEQVFTGEVGYNIGQGCPVTFNLTHDTWSDFMTISNGGLNIKGGTVIAGHCLGSYEPSYTYASPATPPQSSGGYLWVNDDVVRCQEADELYAIGEMKYVSADPNDTTEYSTCIMLCRLDGDPFKTSTAFHYVVEGLITLIQDLSEFKLTGAGDNFYVKSIQSLYLTPKGLVNLSGFTPMFDSGGTPHLDVWQCGSSSSMQHLDIAIPQDNIFACPYFGNGRRSIPINTPVSFGADTPVVRINLTYIIGSISISVKLPDRTDTIDISDMCSLLSSPITLDYNYDVNSLSKILSGVSGGLGIAAGVGTVAAGIATGGAALIPAVIAGAGQGISGLKTFENMAEVTARSGSKGADIISTTGIDDILRLRDYEGGYVRTYVFCVFRPIFTGIDQMKDHIKRFGYQVSVPVQLPASMLTLSAIQAATYPTTITQYFFIKYNEVTLDTTLNGYAAQMEDMLKQGVRIWNNDSTHKGRFKEYY